MRSKIIKLAVSVSLAVAMLLLTPELILSAKNTTSTEAAGQATIKSKDEVVYAVLAPDGSASTLFVVNHFELNQAGELVDYGSYSSIQNLTDTAPLKLAEDAVSFNSAKTDFYYQGNLINSDLPWHFCVAYLLDGKEISPSDLAGRSGQLEIRISSRANQAIDSVFYENYMLQISLALDTEKCWDINGPGATIASAGKNKLLTYTVLPGKDAAISLQAMVEDFVLTGIDIAALPWQMELELPDTDDLLADFGLLADALAALDSGTGDLATGARELANGAASLEDGSTDIKDGLARLSDNSGQLIKASSQISAALEQIVTALQKDPSDLDLESLTLLPQALTSMAGGLTEVAGGLGQLNEAFGAAFAALDGAIQTIADQALSSEQIGLLYLQLDQELYPVLDQLVQSYVAGQTVKGTYEQVRPALAALGPALTTMTGSISEIADGLSLIAQEAGTALAAMDMTDDLNQLTSGLAELNKNYASFHSGLADYMKGVGQLSSGYKAFHSGLSTFSNGIAELKDGAAQLHGGTGELSAETAKLPEKVQDEIDSLLDEYTNFDFNPISFTSGKNTSTSLVQFVIKLEGIQKVEEDKSSAPAVDDKGFWERLTDLFVN